MRHFYGVQIYGSTRAWKVFTRKKDRDAWVEEGKDGAFSPSGIRLGHREHVKAAKVLFGRGLNWVPYEKWVSDIYD